MIKTSIISFSGGLDSTSLLLHLLSKENKVYCLSFNYGQKHQIEITKAKHNIEYFNSRGYDVKHKIINLKDCADILSSSLTNPHKTIPKGYYKEESMMSTVVPNRNAIFSSILYGYALTVSKHINDNVSISLGVHSGDHAIYPDCRKDFYDKIMESFKIGNWDSNKIDIYLPYLTYNKSDILEDALKSIKKLNLNFDKVFKNTITSYNPDKDGLSEGKTGSDIERILAFDSLGLKDPLDYKDSWENVLEYAKKAEKDFKEQ